MQRAAQTAVVTVQAAGLVTGALADANTLAVLGMVSCGSRSPPTTAGRYLVSPFYDYGPLAMAFGNVGLCVVVYAVHGAAVWVYSTAQRVPWGAASAALRFPSIPRLLPVYLVQGAALGGSGLLWTGHVTASDIGFGLLALALVLPFAAVDAAVLRVLVSPAATFSPLREVAPEAHRSWWRRLLIGRGVWSPAEVCRRYGSLFSATVPRRTWYFAVDYGVLYGVAVAASSRPGSGAACVAVYAVISAIFVAAVAAAVVLRPFRRPLDNALYVLKLLLMCCVNGLNSVAALSDYAASVSVVLSAVLLLRMVLGLIGDYLESSVLATGCDPPDAVKGCSQEVTVTLLESEMEKCVEPVTLELCADDEDESAIVPLCCPEIPEETEVVSSVVALQETELVVAEQHRPHLEELYESLG